MRMSATDAQLIEQLKWTDAMIAGAFGIPAYMINAGTAPSYNNVEALTQQYYSQALQILIESIELCLDEGLTLPRGMETEFDLDDLLRMDTATQISAIKDAVSAGIMAPDEGRAKLGLGPTEGGDSPYLQQQNYSLAALAKRDQQADPFAPNTPPANAPAPQEQPQDAIDGEQAALALLALHKGLAHASI
jgi:phage portal protein BeeE